MGLRILKPQGSLFADGSDRHYHAVVSNLDWDAARLLEWHREIAGRMNRNACVMRLRLCASEQTIARICAVWDVFGLATQASYNRPWPPAG